MANLHRDRIVTAIMAYCALDGVVSLLFLPGAFLRFLGDVADTPQREIDGWDWSLEAIVRDLRIIAADLEEAHKTGQDPDEIATDRLIATIEKMKAAQV